MESRPWLAWSERTSRSELTSVGPAGVGVGVGVGEGWGFHISFFFFGSTPGKTSPFAEISHHILVGLSLAVVGGGEGTKPQQGERVSKYGPHVHPLSFFSPSSLFLFQLLYALKTRDNQTSVWRTGESFNQLPNSHFYLKSQSP